MGQLGSPEDYLALGRTFSQTVDLSHLNGHPVDAEPTGFFDPWADMPAPEFPGDALPERLQAILIRTAFRDGIDSNALLMAYVTAASGAAPVSLAWPGADLIYPREWLVGGLAEMTERISALQADDQQREALVCRAGEFVIRTMDEPLVHGALDRTLRKGEVRAR